MEAATKEGKVDQNVPEIITLVNSNDLCGVKNMLISGKAKVDQTDENGMTPLQHAAYKGHLEMCKLLLEYGADVNADYHDHSYSPLHFAALSGNESIVKLFLISGAKSYHTNTLKRTAAQMAGFVGNHTIVALINNYLPISCIEYYTVPQGLETEPKLPLEAGKPLYNLVMQTNLHPVFIALTVERNPVLMKDDSVLSKSSTVLKLMGEKEAKRSDNVNEIICIKLHYLSYVLNSLVKEMRKQISKENEEREKKEDKLKFEIIIKKWLLGRASDGFEEQLEFYVRDAIKSFPYIEMPLFLQLVRNFTTKPDETWAIDILHSVINGQKGFDDSICCSTCGTDNKDAKKCSKCKSVQYCDRTCQRLHWNSHKKFCEKFRKKYDEKLKEGNGLVESNKKEIK